MSTPSGQMTKDVLTTGQVAKICNVTIRTVIKWFEAGKLEGYKIPASKDRRIPKENLRRFLQEHGVPYDPTLFDARPRLLIADDDADLVATLRDVFERSGSIAVHTATNGYEAGYMTARLRPDVLLIDYNLGDRTASEVIATLDRDRTLESTQVLVMTGFLGDEEIEGLEASGLPVFRKPFDYAELEREVRSRLSFRRRA